MSPATAWAALILAAVLTLPGPGVMFVGLVQQLRSLRTQIRPERRPVRTSSDPELADGAQAILDELCARAGGTRVDVIVVPHLDRPAPAAAAGLGTGGPAVTRFRLN